MTENGILTNVQWWSLETWSRSRDTVSKVSGLVSVSVSKDFDLGLELLVSRLCMSYFLYKVLQEAAP